MNQLLRSARRWSAALTGAVFLCFALAANAAAAATTYTVTIIGDGIHSAGAGNYKAGDKVSIAAGQHPNGTPFKKWSDPKGGVTFDDAYSEKTTFAMPRRNVTVTAEFGTDGGLKRLRKTADGETEGTVTDSRDSKEYGWKTIGNRKWMTRNLDYTPETGSSWCYNDSPDSCAKYGRLYDWTTAMKLDDTYKTNAWPGNTYQQQGICPDGWRVPSNGDWSDLIDVAGGSAAAGAKLKATGTSGWSSGTATDNYGFSALGGGYRGTNGTFNYIRTQGLWWSTTPPATVTSANSYYMQNNVNNVYGPSGSVKGIGYSVRCVAYTSEKYAVTINIEGKEDVVTGNGDYEPGATVAINATPPNDGRRFVKWTVVSGGVTLNNESSTENTFTMPGNGVTLTAIFETEVAVPYRVVVVSEGTGASITTFHPVREQVTITAGTLAGHNFKYWSTVNPGIVIADKYSATTTFTMPEYNVEVRAHFVPNFIDNRTGENYGVVTIGDRRWMDRNLNFETEEGSYCYSGLESNCEKYGRLYDWTTAMNIEAKYATTIFDNKGADQQGVCPDGWHLPDTSEWGAMKQAAGGGTTARRKLAAGTGWSGTNNGTDDFGFSALPGGYYTTGWQSAGSTGYWWTSTGVSSTAANAFGQSIGGSTDTIPRSQYGKTYRASVRCVTYLNDTYAVIIEGGGTGASGSGNYKPGATVTIAAGTPPEGKSFLKWTTTSSRVVFADSIKSTTTFIMPGGNDVTITAVFGEVHTIEIISEIDGATGGGRYEPNEIVTLSAVEDPAPSKKFRRWRTTSAGIKITNPYIATITFAMPNNDVTLTAEYMYVFEDKRDGRIYGTVVKDGAMWMAENLQYDTLDGAYTGSTCSDDFCGPGKSGRKYEWVAAMGIETKYRSSERWPGNPIGHRGICPAGWHLPDTAEWRVWTRTYSSSITAARALMAEGYWYENENSANVFIGTDEFGFKALPAQTSGSPKILNVKWWASNDESASNAYGMSFSSSTNGGGVSIASGTKYTYMPNIRCVADAPLPEVTNKSLVYNGKEQSAGIAIAKRGEYNVVGDRATNAGDYTATVVLSAGKYWPDGTNGPLTLTWKIWPDSGVFEPLTLTSPYSEGLRLSDLTEKLQDGYAWAADVDVDTLLKAGVYEFAGTFAGDNYVADNPNFTLASGVITVNVLKADGVFGEVAEISAVYSPTLKLSDLKLPPNYAWDSPGAAAGGVGEYTYNATYTDPSGNYTPAKGTVNVKITPADGTFGAPAPVNVTYSTGLTLGDILLSVTHEGYEWDDPEIELNAGPAQTFAAVYTDPSGNYKAASGVITVNVAKAPGLKAVVPESEAISSADTDPHTIDLDDYIALNKDDHGGLTYELGNETDAGGSLDGKILQRIPSLEGTVLHYQGSGKTVGTATQDIKIISQNYEDIFVTVTFKATGQATYTVKVVSGAGSGEYIAGSAVTITADAVAGKVFDKWETETAGVAIANINEAQTKFTMPAKAVTVTATYKAAVYTVTWVTNGGLPIPAVTSVVHGGSINTPAEMAKEGYRFAGWYTNSDFTAPADFAITDVAKNMTFYAKWTVDSYTVTWHTNGAEALPLTTFVNHGGEVDGPPKDITKAGSFLEGWYANVELTRRAVFPITDVKEDLAFYAKWSATLPSYTITFNANGGTVSPTSGVTGANGRLAALPEPSRAGYVFVGWYTAAAGGVEVVSETVFERSMTIYASWKAVYRVTFNANGGIVSPTSAAISVDGTILSFPMPTRAGYLFAGWYTAATGGIEATGVTVFTDNATVYARWTAVSYTITFNPNGSPVSKTTALTGTGGKLTSLPTPADRAGYLFGGWYTEDTDGTPITTNTEFSGDAEVYARWVPVNYAITYTMNGGSATPANPTVYTIESESITLNNPTRPAHVFDGWTGSNGTVKQTEVTIPHGSTGVKNYTANWTALTFTITFDVNGGTKLAETTRKATGGKLASLPTTTRTNYTLAGWFTEAEGGTEVTANTVFEEDATVYAQWTPVKYTITYALDGGTATPANPTSYTVESDDITLNNPTRPAYRFDGWTGSNGTVKQTEVTIPHGSTGAKSYTANWIALVYTITFDVNGGDALAESSRRVAGGKLSSLPTTTREGYTLVGWFTEEEGGVKVTTSTVFVEDATIYARWSLFTHAAVTFSAGANGSLRASVDGVPIASGDEIGVGKDIVFIAVPNTGYAVSGWKVNGSNIVDKVATYVLSGLSEISTISVTFGEIVGVASPSREIPSGVSVGEAAVAPVKALSSGAAVGPNPVRAGGVAAVYWAGGKAVSGKLGVYNAIGARVATVSVSGVGKVGEWKTDNAAEGTYLIKGTLTGKDGVRAVVSLLVSVVR